MRTNCLRIFIFLQDQLVKLYIRINSYLAGKVFIYFNTTLVKKVPNIYAPYNINEVVHK